MVKVFLDNIILNDSVTWGCKGEIRIRVEGHSGFGAKGGDTVCAGISAVVQTAVLGITRVAGIPQKLTQRDGLIESVIPVGSLGTERHGALRIILHTMITGLDEIAKEYPGSVEVLCSPVKS